MSGGTCGDSGGRTAAGEPCGRATGGGLCFQHADQDPQDGSESLTQKEAAKRLGITPRMLRINTKEGRVPRNPDGSYPWPETEEAYLEFKAEAEEKRAAGFGDDSYEAARARKVAAQARKVEIEALQMEQKLVAVDDVEHLLRSALGRANAVLKRAPKTHARELAELAGIQPRKAREILKGIVEEVRGELREPAA